MFQYFFTGTINMIIILLCAASIAYSVFSEIRAHRKRGKLQEQRS
jgi:hypothetical protein